MDLSLDMWISNSLSQTCSNSSRTLNKCIKSKTTLQLKKHIYSALWIAVTMHQGWGRNHKEPARCLVHTGLRFLPRTMPLCLRKKGKKNPKQNTSQWQFCRRAQQASLCIRAVCCQTAETAGGPLMNQPPFRWPTSWSQTSYQPSYIWHAGVLPPNEHWSQIRGPRGVAVLLNRKWTTSNAPIRLRCRETKHHHPTGRKWRCLNYTDCNECMCVCVHVHVRVRLIYTDQRLHPTPKYLPLCNCHPPTQSCD